MLWSRKLIANVATSIVAGDAPCRSGRKATTSIGIVSAITTAKHTSDAQRPGSSSFVSASV